MTPLMRFPESTCCSFTGHRADRLGIQSRFDPRLADLRERMWEEIARLYNKEGITHFYTGMALGVDTWAAELVLWLRNARPEVTLHCALPCHDQDKNWSDTDRAHYRRLLGMADEVFYLQDGPYRPGCMQARNRFLVERSETLLAVYDGTPGGGTAYTIDYAHKLRRKVLILPPDAPGLTELSELSCVEA